MGKRGRSNRKSDEKRKINWAKEMEERVFLRKASGEKQKDLLTKGKVNCSKLQR